MYITLEVDYGIRILLCLAQSSSRKEAKQIALESSVSLRFALKILRKLVLEGMVVSFKGVKGGYLLAKKPSEISLYDIICSIDGPPYVSRCLSEVGCNRQQEQSCKVRAAFSRISQVLSEEMKAVTLDSLM